MDMLSACGSPHIKNLAIVMKASRLLRFFHIIQVLTIIGTLLFVTRNLLSGN